MLIYFVFQKIQGGKLAYTCTLMNLCTIMHDNDFKAYTYAHVKRWTKPIINYT